MLGSIKATFTGGKRTCHHARLLSAFALFLLCQATWVLSQADLQAYSNGLSHTSIKRFNASTGKFLKITNDRTVDENLEQPFQSQPLLHDSPAQTAPVASHQRLLQQGTTSTRCKMPPTLTSPLTATSAQSCLSEEEIRAATQSGEIKGELTSAYCPCTSLPKFKWLNYVASPLNGPLCFYECPAGFRCSRLAMEATQESAGASDGARELSQLYKGLGTAYGLCIPCTVGEYCEAGSVELTATDMMECEEEARKAAEATMRENELLINAPPLPYTAAPPGMQIQAPPGMQIQAPPGVQTLAPPGVDAANPGSVSGAAPPGGAGRRRLMQTAQEQQLVYKQCNSLRLCPAGMYCPRPNETKPCEEGFYCSGASVRPRTCNLVDALTENPFATVWTAPNFLFKSAQDARVPLSGNYCPAQSASPFGRCGKGNVCPNPSTQTECKKGQYCPEGSYTPRRCTFFFKCREGSSKARWGWNGLALLVFILLSIFAALQWVIHTRTKKVMAQQKEESLVDFVTSLGFYVGRRAVVPRTVWSKIASFFQRDETRSSIDSGAPIAPSPDSFTGIGRIDIRLSVSFRDLSLLIGGGKKCVLQNVTGEFPHSQMHALMGPSGCGKSTFMNTLCGKASYGKMRGNVTIREMHADGTSQPHSFERLRYLTGYVPQEDIVHEILTVRENLYFAAKLRLPRSTGKKELYDLVNCILHMLGLAHVEHSIVGSVEKRGISGGQRKRVNIGMELVGRPSLIFLDEPTSGLDSAVSHDVLESLRKMTQAGMNVIMVIHQPRYSIFEMFDSVLLLGVGGRTVFLGPVVLALPYFTQLGFPLPRNENPADFYLDVISGAVSRMDDEDFVPNQLFQMWEDFGAAWVEERKQAALRGERMNSIEAEAPQHAGNFLARAWPWRPKDLQTIHNRFDMLDVNRDGFLNFDEFLQFWSGMKNIMSNEQYEGFVNEMIQDFGINKSDVVTRESFLATVKAKLRQAAGEDMESPPASSPALHTMKTMERQEVVQSIISGPDSKSKKKLLSTRSNPFKDMMGQQLQNVKEVASVHNVAAQAKNAGTVMAQEAWGAVAMVAGLKSGGRALPTVWRQIYLIILRDRTKSLNQFFTFLFDILLLAVFAALIALVQGDVSSLIRLAGPLTMMLASLALLMSVTALRTFGQENVLFLQRESLGGLSTFAYTIGHMLWDILYMVPRPVIFLVSYLFMLWPEALDNKELFAKFFAVVLLVAWYAYAFGYMMSVMLDKQVAMVAAAGLPLIFGAIINGLNPRLPDVNPGSPMDLLNHLSYGRWAVEGIVISVSQTVYRNQTEAPLVYGFFRAMGFCGSMGHVKNYTQVVNERNARMNNGSRLVSPPPPPFPPTGGQTQLPFGDLALGYSGNGTQGGGLQDTKPLSPSAQQQVDELSKVIYFYNDYEREMDYCDKYFNQALLWLFFLGLAGRVITYMVIKYKVLTRATK